MIKTPSEIRRRPQKERNLTAIDGETISDYLKEQRDLLQQRQDARSTASCEAYISVKDNRIGNSISCQPFNQEKEENNVCSSRKLIRKPTIKQQKW